MTRVTSESDRRRSDERLIASVALGALAVGGVVALARSPRLRRLAWTGVTFAVTTWLPAWGLAQLGAAWAGTRPAPVEQALAPPVDARRA